MTETPRKRKPWLAIFLAAAALGLGLFVGLTYRSSPFPFLSRYPVAGQKVDHRGELTLTLNATYKEVLRAAEDNLVCYATSDGGSYCGSGATGLVILPGADPQCCSVSYRQRATFAERAWTWITTKLRT